MELIKELYLSLQETQIDSSEYKKVNGQNPEGLGVWVFRDEENNETFEFRGNFKEAKEAAQGHLRKATKIKVVAD
jgi:hypothetical protein